MAGVDDAVRLGKNGELETVSKYLIDFKKSPELLAEEIKTAGGYNKWVDSLAKQVNYIFKVITTDITAALNKRIDHIIKIKFEAKGSGYRFSGCHSKSAVDELGTKARIEITIPKNADGVYEAKVFAKGPDGKEIMKVVMGESQPSFLIVGTKQRF